MRVRQLIPTKFATAYGAHRDGKVIPEFCTWWMWLGRSFKVERTVVPYGPIAS
jgi:hypothetical protein